MKTSLLRALAPIPLLLLPGLGCDRPEPVAGAGEALAQGRWAAAPSWVGAARTLSERAGWRLVRGAAATPPEGTDLIPTVELAVIRADGAALLPPQAVVGAALLEGAVAWVAHDGVLLLDDGAQPAAVDAEVIPELDVDATGRLLAYAKGPGPEAGVWIVEREAREPRRLSLGLAVADRPLFVGSDGVLMVGSRPGGIAGLWVASHRSRDPQLRPITNGALRVGEPLGPGFVPPPALHDSMRVEGGALVYDDGETERRVSLAGVVQ